MKRTRHSAEQIVKKLHEAATALAGGKTVEDVCKGLGISPATCHRWQKEYGGADVETVREFKALKEEDTVSLRQACGTGWWRLVKAEWR